jgi:hypothetical protein
VIRKSPPRLALNAFGVEGAELVETNDRLLREAFRGVRGQNMNRVLGVAYALGMIAYGMPATAQAPAIAPDPGKISEAWWASYFKDSRLVVLPDGRKLNLLCQGSGGPVVVLESGLASGARRIRRSCGG